VRWASLIFLPALLVGIGCRSKPEAPPAEAPKVTVAHPEARKLTDVETFNGWLTPDDSVDIRARVKGELLDIYFKDGEEVKKDQLLFKVDPEPYVAEVARLRDQVKVYAAQAVAAEKEYNRQLYLLRNKAGTQADADKAEADFKSYTAQQDAATNQAKRAELNIDYCTIKAPFDGRMGKSQLSRGNMVNAGGSEPVLATIVSVSPIKVSFNIDERSLRRYAKYLNVEGRSLTDLLTNLRDHHATISFALDGETDFPNEATLQFADNRIDPTTGTVLLYAVTDNQKGNFVPGNRVMVRVPISKNYSTFVVPETSILSDQDKRYVLVADKENVVRRRNVILGKLTDDGMRAIEPADKLAEGEKIEDWHVLVDNLQRARLNYPIDPQKPQ
jgi:RND family efflux transporter MFP subunit